VGRFGVSGGEVDSADAAKLRHLTPQIAQRQLNKAFGLAELPPKAF
jgi:hypothetical protein